MRYLAFILFSLLFSCDSVPEGIVLEGKINGAANLQVYLDEVKQGDETSMVGRTEADGNGNFTLEFPDGLKEAIYRLKIGRKEVDIVLDGSENVVEITGDLETLDQYSGEVTGSAATDALEFAMKGLYARSIDLKGINQFIDTTSNAYTAALVTMKAVPIRYDVIEVHKKAMNKLALAHPNSPLAATYEQAVNQVVQAYEAQQAAEVIRVGQMAPDIRLTDPDGKEFALSDLKGQVVMLDFWASWCGPCRRANPSVVQLYDKYKDKGFTIYSVSLDGPRRTNGLSAEQIAQQKERSKDKWIAAIEKDQLKWPYHVSDLNGWGAAPARVYGVSSIPKTFLIDKEGKIVQTGVNPLGGIGKLEQDIQSLLQKG